MNTNEFKKKKLSRPTILRTLCVVGDFSFSTTTTTDNFYREHTTQVSW